MTTIRLGVDDDAIEVEDGASVLLVGESVTATRDSAIRTIDGVVAVCFWSTWRNKRSISSVRLSDGALDGWDDLRLDLPALRRERAPKPATVGGWCMIPRDWQDQTRVLTLPHDQPALTLPRDCAVYWTHRPGNDPTKQARLDAALDYLATEFPTQKNVDEIISAARALGYGKR